MCVLIVKKIWKREGEWDNENLLWNTTSNCSKCGKQGIKVGQSFRYCKNNKEWRILKEKYEKGEIEFNKDFCPYQSSQKKPKVKYDYNCIEIVYVPNPRTTQRICTFSKNKLSILNDYFLD